MLERNPDIDLLFTDVGLPGMNGRELADAARKTSRTEGAVHHWLRAQRDRPPRATRPGVELITKPFTQAALAEKIEQVVGGDQRLPTLTGYDPAATDHDAACLDRAAALDDASDRDARTRLELAPLRRDVGE
jgi:DNA-binding LytR/AlgR family response regulator